MLSPRTFNIYWVLSFGGVQSGTNAMENAQLCIYRIVILGPALTVVTVTDNRFLLYSHLPVFEVGRVEPVETRNFYAPRNGKKIS